MQKQEALSSLVPENARQNDTLFLPKGSPLPFHLREPGSDCRLLDASYVRGMMHNLAVGKSDLAQPELVPV